MFEDTPPESDIHFSNGDNDDVDKDPDVNLHSDSDEHNANESNDGNKIDCPPIY